MRQAVSDLSQGKYNSGTFEVKFPEHYSRIYQANVENIGLVGANAASKIIEFHQLMDSFVQDVSAGGIAAVGTGVRIYEELIVVLERAVEIGSELEKST